MAKLSSINKNNKRIKLSDQYYKKRQKLKKIVMDKKIPLEERLWVQMEDINRPIIKDDFKHSASSVGKFKNNPSAWLCHYGTGQTQSLLSRNCQQSICWSWILLAKR